MSIGYLIESLAVSQIRVMAAGTILLVVPIATSSRRRNFSKPVSDHALVSYRFSGPRECFDSNLGLRPLLLSKHALVH